MGFWFFGKKMDDETFLKNFKDRLAVHTELLRKVGYTRSNKVRGEDLPSFSWHGIHFFNWNYSVREIMQLKSIDEELIMDLIRMHRYNLLSQTPKQEVAKKIMEELKELHNDIELMLNRAGNLKNSDIERLIQTLIEELKSLIDFISAGQRVRLIKTKELTNAEYQVLKEIVDRLGISYYNLKNVRKQSMSDLIQHIPHLTRPAYTGDQICPLPEPGDFGYIVVVALGTPDKNFPDLQFEGFTLLGWYASSFAYRAGYRGSGIDPPYFNHNKKIMLANNGIIYVPEPFRKRGIARHLIKFMERTLKKYGYGNMEAQIDNESLIPLYIALGFSHGGHLRSNYGKLL